MSNMTALWLSRVFFQALNRTSFSAWAPPGHPAGGAYDAPQTP